MSVLFFNLRIIAYSTLNALENVELPALLRGETAVRVKAGAKALLRHNWDWENGDRSGTAFRRRTAACSAGARV